MKKRIKLQIWPPLALCTLLFFYAPLVIYWSNSTDLMYDYFDVIRYMLPIGIAIFAIFILVCLIISAISKKLSIVFTLLITTALLCTYIQGDWLAFNLPTLDGSIIEWERYDIQRIYSIIVWSIALASAAFALLRFKQEKTLFICNLISKILIVLMLISLVITAIGVPGRFYRKKAYSVTYDNILTLSKEKNLVILLLDCINTEDFIQVLQEDSNYSEVFKDFSFYTNAFSGYDATLRCVPHIITGKWYEFQELYQAYLEREIPNSQLLTTLKKENYRIGIYDENFAVYAAKAGLTDNTKDANSFVYPTKFIKMIVKIVGLKYAPYDIKRFCILSLDDLYIDSLKGNGNDNFYSCDNQKVYNFLLDNAVTLSDDKCFRFIHVQGGHAPFELDKNCNTISKEEGSYHRNIESAITLTSLYLDKMKASGVYDNSAIIVLSDHGYQYEEDGKLKRYNPILFIKGINENSSEVSIWDIPVAQEDLSQVYIELIYGKKTEELSMSEYREGRERRHLLGEKNILEEYFQYGHADEKETFISTGNIYMMNVK